MIALSIMTKFIIKTNKTTKKPKFKIITKEEKIRRDIMKIRALAEEENTQQHKNILEDLKKGEDIREATKKHKGQSFLDEIDSLMDNLVIPPECARELSKAMGWDKANKKEMKKIFLM